MNTASAVKPAPGPRWTRKRLVSLAATWTRLTGEHGYALHVDRHYCMVARLCQRFLRLSVPPNRVVKWVESMSTMSPAR